MKLENGMTVIAPCDGNGKIKKGDKFVIKRLCFKNITSFEIKLKNGTKLFCLLKECEQIELKDWIIKPE